MIIYTVGHSTRRSTSSSRCSGPRGSSSSSTSAPSRARVITRNTNRMRCVPRSRPRASATSTSRRSAACARRARTPPTRAGATRRSATTPTTCRPRTSPAASRCRSSGLPLCDRRHAAVAARATRGGALDGWDRDRGLEPCGDAVAVLVRAAHRTRTRLRLRNRGLQTDPDLHLPLGRPPGWAAAEQPVRVGVGGLPRRARDRGARDPRGHRGLARGCLLRRPRRSSHRGARRRLLRRRLLLCHRQRTKRAHVPDARRAGRQVSRAPRWRQSGWRTPCRPTRWGPRGP